MEKFVTPVEPHKSSLGMNASMAVLIILAGPIFTNLLFGFLAFFSSGVPVLGIFPYFACVGLATPIVFFFLEKESRYVKEQAMQTAIFGGAWYVVSVILTVIRQLSWPGEKFLTWRELHNDNYMNRLYDKGKLVTNRYGSPTGYKIVGNSPVFWIFTVLFIICVLAVLAIFAFMLLSALSNKKIKLPIIGPLVDKLGNKIG